MSYYGSWKIDDLVTFCVNTHRFDTGAATDADSPATYRVYEDETSTPILTGTMALLDSANTAGFYSEQITLSAANGFEKGKSYSIYITATVNSVTAATHHNFQLEAEVDANTVSPAVVNSNITQISGDSTAADNAEAFFDGTGYAGTGNTIPVVTLTNTVTTYTGNTPQTGDSFARLGVAGVGLSNLGDTRIANLDAAVSSRLAPAGTLAVVTLATTTTNLTNSPTSGDFTATMKTSLNNSTPAVTVSDKTGFSLSTAGILAIWHQLTSAVVTAATVGKLIVDNLNAAISTVATPANVLTQVNSALDAANTELASVPNNTGSLRNMLQLVFTYFRNRKTITSTTETLFKEDASTSLGTSVVSDDGTTFTKGELT